MFENPFPGIEPPTQQMDYMLDDLMLVPHVEIAIDSRIEDNHDRITKSMLPQTVTQTFRYVPILEVLKVVLKPTAQALIDAESNCIPGCLRSYCDGQQYKQHGVFKTNSNVLL